MTTLENIKSRGYWEVVIRPARFNERRVAKLTDLQKFVLASQVRIRGWPFPVDKGGATRILDDCVAGEIEWSNHRETWRLYQSGMFVWLKANRWDWMEDGPASGRGNPTSRNPPGSALSVGDAVFTICEVFEFASRLALSAAGDNLMRIEVLCHKIRDRRLWVDIWHDTPGRVCEAQSWSFGGDFSQAQLAADARKLALATSVDLFQRFAWDVSTDVLAGILDQYSRT